MARYDPGSKPELFSRYVVTMWTPKRAIINGHGQPLCEVPEITLEFGAGEGIRTLDPNLGKVVLYP
jgi:hypothetical protein